MASEKYREVMEEMKKIGHIVFLAGLNNSHSGNMSVRVGRRILITRRGSMLGFLKDEDIIETGLEEDDSGISLASTEVAVHRAIYQGTSALAILHSHPLTATALSIVQDEIVPIDVEGSYYIRRVPVIEFEFGTGSKEMEEVLPKYLKNYRIVMVKGHGAFAIGDFLEEALHYTHVLENIAQIIWRVRAMGVDTRQFEKEYFHQW